LQLNLDITRAARGIGQLLTAAVGANAIASRQSGEIEARFD
jgi:hypothetical protein